MLVKRKSNVLSHHGIDGQKWGVRNGPPYPLDAGSSGSTSKKKRHHSNNVDSKKKSKKNKNNEEHHVSEKEKKEAIYSGDPKKVRKIQHTLTDEEYKTALNRINMNKSLNSYDNALLDKKLTTATKAAAAVTAISVAASKFAPVANAILGKKRY